EMLFIVELMAVPRPSEVDTVYSAVATGFRCFLQVALLVMFAWHDRRGDIRLSNSADEEWQRQRRGNKSTSYKAEPQYQR
ncbi:hypothetical protein NW759_017475, partial [Fusarium solani]